MRHTGFFISLFLCISPWECFVGGIPTLPHVMHYDVVRLQRLNGRVKRSLSSQQTYPEELEFALAVAGKNYTMLLERNRDLVGENYTLTHYTEKGREVTTSPDHGDHCYYHGHIQDLQDSAVSVGLCAGMRGFVRAEQQVYLVEPLEDAVDGDHAVYRQEHLRRRRATGYCNDSVYDLGPRPAGLHKPNSMKTKPLMETQRFVELVLVVDNAEYKKFGSMKKVEARMLEIANHVDKLYRPLNIRVMLVGLEVWSYRDQMEVSSKPSLTLDRFAEWLKDNLLKRKKHDNAQFVTAVDFDNPTVGLAYVSTMCSPKSCAVNEDHNDSPIGVASTIVHEMGHNLGMSHDGAHCGCGTSVSGKGCIMGGRVGFIYPDTFSSCSRADFKRFLEEYDHSCLLDIPNTDMLYGGPVCGNGFVEKGEECDCGSVEDCRTSCCNASTCRLTEGSHCAHGECCEKNCQLKQTGSLCRESGHDCDLAEYCTGESAHCPKDAYKMNGLPCSNDQGYCYNGQCPTHLQHCKTLWGADAEVAVDKCFYHSMDCRRTRYGNQKKCAPQNMKCGKIFCTGGNDFPITKNKVVVTLNDGSGNKCNMASADASVTEGPDLGMVPTGTKCGTDMVCYSGLCLDTKVYGTEGCSAKCNNHGVCNHESKCHCDPGWAPPYCDVKRANLAPAGGDAVVVGVSTAVAVLVLLTLAAGGMMCWRNQNNQKIAYPTKRSFRGVRTTSGQSNPVFQAGSARNSPRCGPPRISQANQACKPLYVTVVPSRPAPQPPKTTIPTLQQSRPKQLGKLPIPPPIVPSKVHQSQAKPLLPPSKPLPPSRPLPPLNAKPVNKPKPPPVPLVKPSGIQSPWKQPQVTVGQKVALKPPTKPR